MVQKYDLHQLVVRHACQALLYPSPIEQGFYGETQLLQFERLAACISQEPDLEFQLEPFFCIGKINIIKWVKGLSNYWYALELRHKLEGNFVGDSEGGCSMSSSYYEVRFCW